MQSEHPLVTYLRLTDRTQAWLARETGYTGAYISQIVQGRDVPEETLAKLARVTGVSMVLLRAAIRPEDQAA